MRLLGQRWVYRIGNSVIQIDNGFAWIGWAQERMIVNEETVQASDGWLRTNQDYFEPWIVPGGEGLLTIKLLAGLKSIHCSASLDGAPLEPAETFNAKWSGPKRSWPDDADWTPVAP